MSPNSKKLLIFLTLILLVLIIITLVIPKPSPGPSTSPSSTSIPQASISPFSNYLQPLQSISQPQEPVKQQQITLYHSPDISTETTKAFFTPIATNLGFTNSPQTKTFSGINNLVWENQSSYFFANLQSTSFSFKLMLSPDESPLINSDQALTLATNWLTQFHLIPPNPQSQITYLRATNYQLTPTTNPDQADYYQINFYPQLNQLPIFSPGLTDYPISFTLTNQGKIFMLNYQIPALFYSSYISSPSSLSTSTIPIKSQAQLDQEIETGLPTITSSEYSPGQYQDSTTNINQLNYHTITLGLQTNPNLNLLTPVFQLKGSAVLTTGRTTTVTAYLSATP